MLIGILSDTHDELDRTLSAIELLRKKGAAGLIHCGDLTNSSIVKACSALPFWFVFGNHDADTVPELEITAKETGAICLGWSDVIILENRHIAVAHGHMSYDIRRALNARPDYLLTGHSHISSDTRVGIVRRINPGALHEAEQFTVALLNLTSDELEFLTLQS